MPGKANARCDVWCGTECGSKRGHTRANPGHHANRKRRARRLGVAQAIRGDGCGGWNRTTNLHGLVPSVDRRLGSPRRPWMATPGPTSWQLGHQEAQDVGITCFSPPREASPDAPRFHLRRNSARPSPRPRCPPEAPELPESEDRPSTAEIGEAHRILRVRSKAFRRFRAPRPRAPLRDRSAFFRDRAGWTCPCPCSGREPTSTDVHP